MRKVIVLLGKNGDIAMVANHYIKNHYHPDKPKPVWIVSKSFAPILYELYADYFDIYPVDISAANPLDAFRLAKFVFPAERIALVQQNGTDTDMTETRNFRNFQHFQLAKLDDLFQ